MEGSITIKREGGDATATETRFFPPGISSIVNLLIEIQRVFKLESFIFQP